MGNESLPEELLLALRNGKEETYLEYKGNVSWRDDPKKLEIVQTIYAMANKREGGIIVIGVEDNGTRVGLSDDHATRTTGFLGEDQLQLYHQQSLLQIQ